MIILFLLGGFGNLVRISAVFKLWFSIGLGFFLN